MSSFASSSSHYYRRQSFTTTSATTTLPSAHAAPAITVISPTSSGPSTPPGLFQFHPWVFGSTILATLLLFVSFLLAVLSLPMADWAVCIDNSFRDATASGLTNRMILRCGLYQCCQPILIPDVNGWECKSIPENDNSAMSLSINMARYFAIATVVFAVLGTVAASISVCRHYRRMDHAVWRTMVRFVLGPALTVLFGALTLITFKNFWADRIAPLVANKTASILLHVSCSYSVSFGKMLGSVSCAAVALAMALFFLIREFVRALLRPSGNSELQPHPGRAYQQHRPRSSSSANPYGSSLTQISGSTSTVFASPEESMLSKVLALPRSAATLTGMAASTVVHEMSPA